MSNPPVARFARNLDRAAREFLAARGDAYREECRMGVEECPLHGPMCARVTLGMLREHFDAFRADPVQAAATLLVTILPTSPAPGITASTVPPDAPAAVGDPCDGSLHAR